MIQTSIKITNYQLAKGWISLETFMKPIRDGGILHQTTGKIESGIVGVNV